MDHECPRRGCTAKVPYEMLACRPHWFSVPKPLRDAVWAAYRGPGPGSAAHNAAIRDAIEAMNRD